MRNLILILMMALMLQGCLSQSQNETDASDNSGVCNYALCFADQKPSSHASSCAAVSPTENAYTEALLDSAINSNTSPNGEYHPDAVFNIIEEVGRRGCDDSLDGLMEIAESVEATRTIDNGVVEYAFLGTRKLQAVIEALTAIAEPSDDDAMAFLNRIANESSPIRDGINGHFLQDLARNTIAKINYGSGRPPSKRFQYSWNNIPACSTNYLLTNGTRTNFISDWEDYVDQIQNLNPSSIVLRDLAHEPLYCDGLNGFRSQELAIRKLELSNHIDALNFTKSLLDSDPLRGSVIGLKAVQKLYSIEEPFDVTAIEDMTQYLDLNTGHPDEMVRTEIVGVVVENCAKILYADSECSSAIENDLKTSAKKDPYYIVRLRAQQGLDYLDLVKKELQNNN